MLVGYSVFLVASLLASAAADSHSHGLKRGGLSQRSRLTAAATQGEARVEREHRGFDYTGAARGATRPAAIALPSLGEFVAGSFRENVSALSRISAVSRASPEVDTSISERPQVQPDASSPPIRKRGSEFWDWVFHCSGDSGFQGPLALSHAMLILAALCLFIGSIATAFEYKYGAAPGDPWHPLIETFLLGCSVFGGCLVYIYDIFSDTMVLIGFAYCGFYLWMVVGICIMVNAQFFAAWEFSHKGETYLGKLKFFMIAICQGHIFMDAADSWRKGRVTPFFARHKFIEAVWESGPQAMLAVYVIYYLDQRFNFWLVLSIFGSVVGLAYGISIWLDYSFNAQLDEDHIPPSEYSIRWYHHALWMAYFTMDFGLRLLTIGLFLSTTALRPYNQIIFAVLILLYLLAVMISTHVYHTESGIEVWQISETETIQIQRQVLAQRVIDGLILTFFVHMLPADIRLAPKHPTESRLLFALHPELRTRIMKTIIPLRALDYIGLGGAAMWYRWDQSQALALVSMFIVMHLMLYAVLRLKRPPSNLERCASDELTPELVRVITGLSEDAPDPTPQARRQASFSQPRVPFPAGGVSRGQPTVIREEVA